MTETKPHILVVDDVAFMRNLLGGILTSLGYPWQGAASSEEAVRLIRAETPRLIILDIMMPEVDGIALCRWVRANEKTRETPVLVCTAQQERRQVEAAIRAGATDILLKPVDKRKLQERLEKHLGPREDPPG